MRFRDLVATSVGNLTRHKARTALTTVGVVVGILTIVTMVSLGIGVQSEMMGAFDSVGLESLQLYPVTEDTNAFDPYGQAQRTRLLSADLVKELEERDDVIAVEPWLSLPRGLRLNAIVEDQEVRVDPWAPRPSSIPGPFETQPRTLAGVGEPPPEGGWIVLGSGAAKQLGYGDDDFADLVGQDVQLVLHAARGESQSYDLKIAGVTDSGWGTIALAVPDRLSLLEWWFNDPEYLDRRGYDEVFVRAKTLNDATQVLDYLDGLGYQVRSLKTMLDVVNRGMIILQTMLASVGTLALLVASIGIANTMIMAVYERTKEIGILKAVGAAPGQIRTLFVVEASMIGLLGGVVGTVGGWLLGIGLNQLILAILKWQDVNIQEGTFFVVRWWLVVGALAFATLVGLLAGLYPAARAARLAPLDALRYE